MAESFYEATRPSLNNKPMGRFGLFRWLERHPKFILPLVGISIV